MTERLIISLPQHLDQDALWAPADASGRLLGTVQRGPLAAAAAMAADRRVIALVPAEQLMLTRVAVPGLRGARLRQAIPYALEERLAVDVDDVHCALGPVGDDDQHAVAVVEHRLMTDWLAALNAAGLRADALVPDCLALPWDGDGEVTVALTGDRALLRDGLATGFSCELDLLEPMLAARGLETPATRVGAAREVPVPDRLAATPVTVLPEGVLPWLAPQAVEPTVNLLQGAYAPRQRRAAALGRWRLPAALAAAWLVVAIVTWALEYRAIAATHARQQAEIQSIFSSVVTDEPMVDPRIQLERRLGGGAADGELLRLLAAVAEGAADASGVEMRGLTYRPGQLDLSVTAGSVQQLDALRDRVAAAGSISATIDAASSAGDAVEGRLQLRSGR